MKKIRKAIIPAAGFGTRFLPATKAVPKEMLPIVDKPTIQYIVEEAVKSGIEEILLITNCYKSCIENHFDTSFELEKKLEQSNDIEHLEMVRKIAAMANVYSVRQKNPRGLGHAVPCAKSFVGDEPFAILLGDDIVNQTIPLILCAEEDVEGNHGASMGDLDDATLFYLCSRGLSREEAERMVARARIDALNELVADEAVQKQVQEFMNQKR